MRNFLGPIIEAAGYRVVDGDEPADIAFVDGAADADCAARKAIHLRSTPGSGGAGSGEGVDSIYRYDRAGLMAALLRAGEELAA
jgi:two-component system chemotaxis sensor kinase CheA